MAEAANPTIPKETVTVMRLVDWCGHGTHNKLDGRAQATEPKASWSTPAMMTMVSQCGEHA